MKCKHGKRVWGNYGDGKVRHLSDSGAPLMDVCSEYRKVRQ